MKKTFLIPFVIALMIFGGCTAVEEEVVDVDDAEVKAEPEVVVAVEPEVEVEAAAEIEPEVVADSVYEQWAMPSADSDEGFVMTQNLKPDCIGTLNGDTGGGDLLSSLIVDDVLRDELDLDLYSTSYIKVLEKKLATYTRSRYDADFYAFSVCNLEDGMDLVAGYGKLASNEVSSLANRYWEYRDEQILLLVNGEDVVEINNSVRLFNQTATGAEVAPCEGVLEEEEIVWTCFMGLLHVDRGAPVDGASYKSWKISPEDGSVLDTWEYVKEY